MGAPYRVSGVNIVIGKSMEYAADIPVGLATLAVAIKPGPLKV